MDRLNLDKLKMLAAVTTLAMFAGVASAEHETQIYGQLNRTVTGTDDGIHQNTFFNDNAFSPTNLGVKSMAHVNKCVSVGGVLETQFNVGNSLNVNQLSAEDTDNHKILVRTADVWMAHSGLWGKLSLGYGNAASYGITRMSYSRAGDTVSSASVANLAGGMRFQTTTSTGDSTDLTVFNAFANPDGVGSYDHTGYFRQQNRVRWDSGMWNGLSLAVSHGKVNDRDLDVANFGALTGVNRSFTDVALRYEQKFDDFMVSAGAAWAKYSRNGIMTEDYATAAAALGVTLPAGTARGQRIYAGSVAVEHAPTGINAAVSYAAKRKATSALSNKKVWFVQLGKHFHFTNYGRTNFVLDYFQAKNALVDSDKSKSYALGVVQDLDKANASVYATVRNYKYNPNTASAVRFKTMKVAAAGFMFKFGAML
jgi:hypothetical protein